MYHYYITIKRLRDVMTEQRIAMGVDTFFRLLGKMAASISIPFRGEPLSGLQVMGVLETRALDFENLIILSMNEGIFPVKKVAPSFIPYNLRRGFGMATTEHQDSIYAYYFYRMISRAKRVFLLYDSRTDGLKSGEVSRYVYQLKYHYRLPIQEIQINCDIATFSPTTITVDKHRYGIDRKLAAFLSGGDSALSASAINRYLNCPLQFYLQYIEGLERPDEVAESVDSGTFGSIYHGMMQRIYERIEGDREQVTVTADHIDAIRKDKPLLTPLPRGVLCPRLLQNTATPPAAHRIRLPHGRNHSQAHRQDPREGPLAHPVCLPGFRVAHHGRSSHQRPTRRATEGVHRPGGRVQRPHPHRRLQDRQGAARLQIGRRALRQLGHRTP